MKRLHTISVVVAATLAFVVEGIQPTVACTGIRIKPQDGSVLVARTLEFAANLHSEVLVIPRAMDFTGTAPGGKAGLHWKSKYACLGANGFGLPAIVDGLNEKGLSAAIFYFPGYAKYQAVKEEDIDKTIAPWELPVYLLGNCANVEEAKKTLSEIRVGDVFQKAMDMVTPCHYIISDAEGRCIVVEYVNGVLAVNENPLGVITNSPTFDWHLYQSSQLRQSYGEQRAAD